MAQVHQVNLALKQSQELLGDSALLAKEVRHQETAGGEGGRASWGFDGASSIQGTRLAQ